MSKYCPACKRVLYDRCLHHCGFCGSEIPEYLRFTPEKIAAIDREIDELAEQNKARERNKPQDDGGYDDLGYLGLGVVDSGD